MSLRTLVIRGKFVLSRPDGDPSGPVPTMAEVVEFLTVIEYRDYEGIRVVTSSTGEPPDGWRWVPLMELQAAAGTEADEIGEALLCA